MWALNTQLDERWWTSLQEQSILYLGHQRTENLALKNAGKPYTKGSLKQNQMALMLFRTPYPKSSRSSSR
jgi:hypothetical protein